MKPVWKKRVLNALWLLFAAGGLTLLIASVKIKRDAFCRDIKIEVSGSSNNFFIDEKEVISILNANGLLTEQKVSEINLHVLERRLEHDTWISEAELFFDKHSVLNVKIEEREPVARVFSSSGASFYIDSSCHRLPLSERVLVRVPMFTSFPSAVRKLRAKDSALLAAVKELAVFIRTSKFWNAQVAQVDITPNRTFEMIPVVGNHIVALGKPNDFEEKFDRLYSFYKHIWPKVGLEKYSRIDVQYRGQVVAVRRGSSSGTIDSVQARRAFEDLMKENKQMQEEESGRPVVRIRQKLKRVADSAFIIYNRSGDDEGQADPGSLTVSGSRGTGKPGL